MFHVSLELFKWEINDKTHSEIKGTNTSTIINVELMEFIVPQKLLNWVLEIDELFFCKFRLTAKDLLGHNLIGSDKLFISTLKHINFLSEITLSSLLCQISWKLFHVHLTTCLLEFLFNRFRGCLHKQNEEEKLSEWNLSILINVSNTQDTLYCTLILCKIVLVLLWFGVIEWSHCF